MESLQLDENKLLEFGIEIVAAMKADCYDCSIEEGRELALEGTIFDNELYLNELYLMVDKSRLIEITELEKKRLHKQALFVAKIALMKLNSLKYDTES